MKVLIILAAVFIGLVVLAMFLGGGRGLCNTKRENIRDLLIQETPLGTTRGEVQQWLLRKKTFKFQVSEKGFLKREREQFSVVGVTSIRASLAKCFVFPFYQKTIVADWGFDDRGNLIDVWVSTYVDAP